jgi:hypothetical protein
MTSRAVDADDLLIKIVAALLVVCALIAAYSWTSGDAEAQSAESLTANTHSAFLLPGSASSGVNENYPNPALDRPRTLYKCLARSGELTIGNDPCSTGSKTIWVRNVAAVWNPRPESAWEQRQHLQQVQSDLAGSIRDENGQTSYVGTTSTTDPSFQCQMAKQDRENYLKVVGLKRTFDMLRALNERVWEACKGR